MIANLIFSIGVDYKSKIFDVYGKRVKATIWDTGMLLTKVDQYMYNSWSREI
jgi:hypothetical protein